MIKYNVKFKKLLACLRYDTDSEFTFHTPNYNGEAHMCAKHVLEAFTNGEKEDDRYFGENGSLNKDVEPTRQYHISRVIYFMNHPELIVDIRVKSAWWMQDNKVCSHPHLQIEDGYHRVLAGICLGWEDESVEIVNYDYIRQDVLDYLLYDSYQLPKTMRYIDINLL